MFSPVQGGGRGRADSNETLRQRRKNRRKDADHKFGSPRYLLLRYDCFLFASYPWLGAMGHTFPPHYVAQAVNYRLSPDFNGSGGY